MISHPFIIMDYFMSKTADLGPRNFRVDIDEFIRQSTGQFAHLKQIEDTSLNQFGIGQKSISPHITGIAVNSINMRDNFCH